MTAESATVDRSSVAPSIGRPLLGFGTIARKELTESLRGPKALIILGVSVLGAVFMTLIPFIAEATHEAEAAGLMTHDPTANVLLGWTGQTGNAASTRLWRIIIARASCGCRSRPRRT